MRVALNCLFLLAFTGIAFAQACPPEFSGDGKILIGQGRMSCSVAGDMVTWTVSRPEVRRRITDYPEIEFRSGDKVTVSAGGCVDTGGVGKTWKKYVGPWGLATDRLYHGLIWIPGARVVSGNDHLIVPVGTSLVRISSITAGPNNSPAAQQLVVEDLPLGVPHSLHLGYEDDQYDDNGYPSPGDPHGARKGNNCEHAQDAFVRIEISHSETVGPNTLGPLDPVARSYDPNGFQMSPAWFWNYPANPPHEKPRLRIPPDKVDILKSCNNFRYGNPLLVHEGVESSCTRQVSFDQPPSLSQCLLEPGFGELHGHVNWAPATYFGRLTFEEFSTDNDLDFELFDFKRDDPNARFRSWYPEGWWNRSDTINPILSKDSQISAEYVANLHLEFGGYEVTEFFSRPHLPIHEQDRGWQMFRYEYAKDPVARAVRLQQLINGKTASITGLLNLDCVHECHTELHPIQAMAVRTRREDCRPGTTLSDIVSPGARAQKPVSVACAAGDLDARNDDSWLIFARNSGNEGSCSLDQHWVDRDFLRIFLPAPAGATRIIPAVRGNPREIFFSNFPGMRWRIDPAGDGQSGAVLTLFLKPSGCVPQPTGGANIRVHGVLHLNWMTDDDRSTDLSFDTIGSYKSDFQSHDRQATRESILKSLPEPQFFDLESVWPTADEAPVGCPTEPGPPPSDDLLNSRIIHEARDAEDQLLRQRVLIKPVSLFSKETLRSLFTDYVKANIGVFWQDLKIPGASNTGAGGGLRTELLQTPLGSIEIEGAFSHAYSASAHDLWTFEYLYGLRIQLFRKGAIYVDPKGGNLRRWTGLETPPGSDYSRFHGSDSFFYIGGGFQPNLRVGRFPVRVAAGVMILPATGERIFRVTIGPQLQLSK